MADTVPDRVDNFGSNGVFSKTEEPVVENTITHENLEANANKLPRPTGYVVF